MQKFLFQLRDEQKCLWYQQNRLYHHFKLKDWKNNGLVFWKEAVRQKSDYSKKNEQGHEGLGKLSTAARDKQTQKQGGWKCPWLQTHWIERSHLGP